MQSEYDSTLLQQYAALDINYNYMQPQPAYSTHPVASTSQQMYQYQPLPSSATSTLVHRSTRSNNRRQSPVHLPPLSSPAQSQQSIYSSSPSPSSAFINPSLPPLRQRRSRRTTISEEAPVSPPGKNATEAEKIAWKRHQNTLAAQRSRKRKLENLTLLQETVGVLTKETERWKTRAEFMQRLLKQHGILNVCFRDDE